jgi:Thiolase, C-terminal domain
VIALGHPLGASAFRLATTAVNRLHATSGRHALATMCIGVGQGIAVGLERVGIGNGSGPRVAIARNRQATIKPSPSAATMRRELIETKNERRPE